MDKHTYNALKTLISNWRFEADKFEASMGDTDKVHIAKQAAFSARANALRDCAVDLELCVEIADIQG